ncbi:MULTISPECIES: HD domain-containing protein [Caloramator]|uniref:Metal dependent phosphohydrolase n=1 Tax=Caloramator proteoclasticus DSM 10124 TaxID=1121262 RepID=A0A1M4WSJ6_9CLOT|nr:MULTISPECIES: HD domain-containing protein [Caloramator]SHE84178.1 metal dependent phosphohydrolase [Caloramator proteoclasticus DSM 10124]
MITLNDVKNNEEVKTYMQQGDKFLGSMGFTEHSLRHATIVSNIASDILKKLGYSDREVELAAIAGFLHDIGNVVSRHDHGQTGAILAMRILKEMGMKYDEIAYIASAIGNHEEEYGHPVNDIAAALIIADKTDVHRGRVRNKEFATFDIHDRVNYAAEKSEVEIIKDERIIRLNLKINIEICPVMEYFEIFLARMMMCRKAAAFLNTNFQLVINDARLL